MYLHRAVLCLARLLPALVILANQAQAQGSDNATDVQSSGNATDAQSSGGAADAQRGGGGSRDTCAAAAAAVPGRVFLPNSAVYDASQSSYFTADARSPVPGCVFRPESTDEISRFVKAVTRADRCEANCPSPLFAVRGGGHTLWRGAANVDRGITIDMRGMKSFALSGDKKVASVGAGSNFLDVYPRLVPEGLTVIGARVPGVAAGGFLSGGGKSYLARRHGFACDNIPGYELVLASGEVVEATASKNRDLWLAVKGGSNNFGIITRYDLATYPLGRMWGGSTALNYTPEVLRAQADAFAGYMAPANFDDLADAGVLFNFLNATFSVGNTLTYSAEKADPPVYANFTKIPGIVQKSLEFRTVTEFIEFTGAFLPDTIPRSFELTYSFRSPSAAVYLELFQTWEAGVRRIAGIPGLGIQFLFQTLPVTNGTNSIGLAPNQRDSVMATLTAAWPNVADDNAAKGAVRDIIRRHQAILARAGKGIPLIYTNYADVEQNPIATYGADNIRRLWAASRKYDPKGLFQKRVPGYKLPGGGY